MNFSDVHIFIMTVAFAYGASSECNRKQVKSHSNDALVVKETTQNSKPRKRCCPYDFDSSLCKIIDDRVLCGFNRNQGIPESKGQYKPLSGGCRLRGGRVECGYFEGPYEGIRRPPPDWDNSLQEYPNEPTTEAGKHAGEVIEYDVSKETLKHTVTAEPIYYGVTKCVEIHSRVVCRQT
ncbi:hypothetical protein MSG28_008765 [Choristoneura fumiferana]|uniref:Uncharacterized protein n=1 Tax=Choristoneura fumiferana TaxID=7141 RepID=A0ACC0J7Y4_CHOFU|nr:hypothetical protein MSG28_008765 [Choristoneura fumiferana]